MVRPRTGVRAPRRAVLCLELLPAGDGAQAVRCADVERARDQQREAEAVRPLAGPLSTASKGHPLTFLLLSGVSIPDAIQCHQRALLATEPGEGSDIALRIGKLYAALGQGEPAAAYHRRALNEGIRAGLGAAELGRVYLWLAKWEMRRGNAAEVAAAAAAASAAAGSGSGSGAGGRGPDLDKAEEYLRALEGTQEYREEAKGLLKELEVQLLSRA